MASVPPSGAANFAQALQLHQQGDLPAAAALYEAIIALDAAHFDALHLLGVIAAQSDDPVRALELIDRALAVDAAPAQAHYHRALALRDLGRNTEAVAAFTDVLSRDPGHTEAWLHQAETLQALGRHTEALQGYDRAVSLSGGNTDMLFARGVLLQHLQQQTDALADYDRVLALQPDFAGALNNRALALQALQRPLEALAAFDRLLALAPTHAPAHLGRAATLAGLRRHDDALAAYEKALALDEASAQAWFEHGVLLQGQGRHAAALASYARALALHPGFAEALNNRAQALLAQGQFEPALAACDEAIAARADFAEAHCNRGLALGALGRHAEALTSHEQAIALRPDYTEARFNRGHELLELRRLPEALQSCEEAVALETRNPQYLYGLGAVLHRMERIGDALDAYDAALAQKPDYLPALANRAAALRALGRFAEAAACLTRMLEIDPAHPHALGDRLFAQLSVCDWNAYDAARGRLRSEIVAGHLADTPFSHLAITASAAEQRACARLYAAPIRAAAQPPCFARHQHERIRLAYVAADLGLQPVSSLMAELLEQHDRRRFEVTAITLRASGDGAFERRIRAALDHCIDASAMDEERIAALMREREIDIAVDLIGYAHHSRSDLYAHRPAPVQAAYLGYTGTLDMDCMDYLIADAVAIPSYAARHYAEALVHLPATFMPRDTGVQAAPTPTRPDAGLPERSFIFGCFNRAYKLNPPMFDVWMRLLKRVPRSVLWLADPGEPARGNLRREAGVRGVEPARLVFAPRVARVEDHLGRLALTDLFLDTLPCNAHATASDALWAGVPLITCTGEAYASRVAASLLNAAGLPELVTGNLRDYEALALSLAGDPARLREMRERLTRQRETGQLFSTPRLRDSLELAYQRMVERNRQGLPPESFAV